MARLALLDGNDIVENIVIADLTDFPDAINLTATGLTCGIGWHWNGTDFDPPVSVSKRILSRTEFIDRWEFSELVALKGLVAQATGASPSQDSLEAAVFWDQVMGRETINLDSPLAQAAKLALVSWGVFTSTRADEIFV